MKIILMFLVVLSSSISAKIDRHESQLRHKNDSKFVTEQDSKSESNDFACGFDLIHDNEKSNMTLDAPVQTREGEVTRTMLTLYVNYKYRDARNWISEEALRAKLIETTHYFYAISRGRIKLVGKDNRINNPHILTLDYSHKEIPNSSSGDANFWALYDDARLFQREGSIDKTFEEQFGHKLTDYDLVNLVMPKHNSSASGVALCMNLQNPNPEDRGNADGLNCRTANFS